MSNKINKLRRKLNKPHKVLNRNSNFPVLYFCTGDKKAYAFFQKGGYDYNAEVARCADNYGAEVAIKIEEEMHHQDDLMDEGKIPYSFATFSETQMNAHFLKRPENTDLFLFESKNAPYSLAEITHMVNSELNLIDNQDSTVSAYIRAHDINEARKIFDVFKNTKLNYQSDKGTWMAIPHDGMRV